jgi:hypothetical protein
VKAQAPIQMSISPAKSSLSSTRKSMARAMPSTIRKRQYQRRSDPLFTGGRADSSPDRSTTRVRSRIAHESEETHENDEAGCQQRFPRASALSSAVSMVTWFLFAARLSAVSAVAAVVVTPPFWPDRP